MKLYFSPGACSLAPHIALAASGLNYEIIKVDLKTHLIENGNDFYEINPKGSVPTLEITPQKILTEGPAILQYIADQASEKHLAPPSGEFERYRLQEALNYISTEVHKGFSPLWNPSTPEETKSSTIEKLTRQFKYIETKLAKNTYFTGSHVNIADFYLFTVLKWSEHLKVDLTPFVKITDYIARMLKQPAVLKAMKEEGLKVQD